MDEIRISLNDRSHTLYLGRGTMSIFPEIYRSHSLPRAVSIISDRNVARLHLRTLRNGLRHHGYDVAEFLISPGEQQKSFQRAYALVARLLKSGRGRSSSIIALGGGVVGDLAGFVAAIYRRGIPLVQVPTTLLGQIESSIGGKVAVNHPLSKNAMGAFHQPAFIFSDVAFLETLPKREWISGLGEAVKYGMLEPAILQFFEAHLDDVLRQDLSVVRDLLRLCNAHKARLIGEDERETKSDGGRNVLNLGHTIGHVLERVSNFRLRHGEAVLIGLRWELALGLKSGIISRPAHDRFEALLHRIPYHPRLTVPFLKAVHREILDLAGKSTFILARAPGDIVAVKDISGDILRNVLTSSAIPR